MDFYFGYKMIDKILDWQNMLIAARKTLHGKRRNINTSHLLNNIEYTIFELTNEIKNETYKPEAHHEFIIREPKMRTVEALPIKDRIIQKAIHNCICDIFVNSFTNTTYSCIKNRGLHKASNDLNDEIKKHPNGFYLKMDIKKYFQSIDRKILYSMVKKKIKCKSTLKLLRLFLFYNDDNIGLPLGNLTSQIFANLYLSKFDWFIYHNYKVKMFRYMDDMVIIHNDINYLKFILEESKKFLNNKLHLNLNERTVINSVKTGVTFIGFVHYGYKIRIRNATLQKIKKHLKSRKERSITSVMGLLKHGNNYTLAKQLLEEYSLSDIYKFKKWNTNI